MKTKDKQTQQLHNQDADKNSERIFRSEFPQKPDALINFLRDFGTNWNISLFHYRNLV